MEIPDRFVIVSLVPLASLLYLLIIKTREAFFSPLSTIPGPTIAKWTNLRLKLAVLKGNRMHYVHFLHQEYGPIVRISPYEVSITDPVAAKEIHRVQGGYRKSDFYLNFVGAKKPNLFSETDIKKHNDRRRLYSATFSSSFIKRVEGPIRNKVEFAVARMREELQAQGTVDVMKWWTLMTTDVIGELSFGDSFRMLELGKKNEYLDDLGKAGRFGGIFAELPFLKPIFANVPIPAFKKLALRRARIDGYGEESIARYKRSLSDNPSQTTPTFFTKMIQSHALSDQMVQIEASGLIIAGTDTTAIALTYLVWVILSNPDVHQKALQEIKTHLPENFDSDTIAAKLPYLHCVIEETLRLYGSVQSSLHRIVPSGGRELVGHFLPENSKICTQAYTIHRDKNVFREPLQFRPERWENPTQAMKDAFHPFGAGARVCLGIHLAYTELRLGLVLFLKAFPHAFIAPETTQQTMAQQDYFLARPVGHCCMISASSEEGTKGTRGVEGGTDGYTEKGTTAQ